MARLDVDWGYAEVRLGMVVVGGSGLEVREEEFTNLWVYFVIVFNPRNHSLS